MKSQKAGVLPEGSIRLLQDSDTHALLAFELQHKAYFDSLIAMRPAGFYSVGGVESHIRELIALYQAGEAYPCVITDNEAIIGRANLRTFDHEESSAYVGYRVAENRQGQGVASAALAALLVGAREAFGLKILKANVLDNNPASAHILEKQGFVCTDYTERFLRLQCQCLGCRHYELEL